MIDNFAEKWSFFVGNKAINKGSRRTYKTKGSQPDCSEGAAKFKRTESSLTTITFCGS